METAGPEGRSGVGLKEHCLRIRHLISGWAWPLTLCLCGYPGPEGLASAEPSLTPSSLDATILTIFWFLKSSLFLWTIHFTSLVPQPRSSPYSTSVNLSSLANSYQEADSAPWRVIEESSVKTSEAKVWASLEVPTRHRETRGTSEVGSVCSPQAWSSNRRSRYCTREIWAMDRVSGRQQPPHTKAASGSQRTKRRRCRQSWPFQRDTRNHRKKTAASLAPFKSCARFGKT